MKQVFFTLFMVLLLSTVVGLGVVNAKRFDSASPKLASDQNGTTENRENVDTPGHADFVKSQSNSTKKSQEKK